MVCIPTLEHGNEKNPTVFWSIGVMGKNQTQKLPDWTFFFAPKQKALRVHAQYSNTPGNLSRRSQSTLTTPKERGFLNLIKRKEKFENAPHYAMGIQQYRYQKATHTGKRTWHQAYNIPDIN
jgi:hypothetical protein